MSIAAIDADIEVTLHGGQWLGACAGAEAQVATAARLALARGGDGTALAGGARVIVDITLTDDPELRVLNRTYRGKDVPTNVLAFPAADPAESPPPGMPLLLGDVVLAFTTIRREAEAQDKPFADHLRHLVVHGVLHLLGYDHQTSTDAAVMEAREIAIMAELGVPDPYRDPM